MSGRRGCNWDREVVWLDEIYPYIVNEHHTSGNAIGKMSKYIKTKLEKAEKRKRFRRVPGCKHD